MEFIIEHLEIIVATVGGISIGGIMLFCKGKGNTRENDLSQLYVKYKKHSDNVNKSSKTLF